VSNNSQKMTLEEKLVQHIKEVGLGALITDEDAITELTRKAVEQALFQPRRIPNGSYHYTDKDAPVVEAARKIADGALAKIFEKRIKALFDDPQSKQALDKAIANAFPKILMKSIQDGLHNYVSGFSFQLEEQVLNALRGRGLPV
jgi:hypothetical protein